MTVEIRVTPEAELDVIEILEYTVAEHGISGYDKYESLIKAAYNDISTNPTGIGAKLLTGVKADTFAWHLKNSRNSVQPASRVRYPKHVIYYKFLKNPNIVVIERVLHERMLPSTHL